jgi:hypothetical protein
MEVDQFFIDKMMSNSSQDSYVVTMTDTHTYHLDAIVPSIEEIVLAKCDVLTASERRILEATSGTTPEGRQVWERGLAKMAAGDDCKQKVLDDIRREAFKRQLRALSVSTESHKREIEALTVPGPEPPLTPQQALLRGLFQKGMEALARDDKTEASRWFHQASDAGGIDAMKAIGRFYEGLPDAPEAVNWYEAAARRGDAEAMLVLGRMYFYGLSLEQNCITALYWYEKAAAAGDDDAKDFLQESAFVDKVCPKPGVIGPPRPSLDEILGPPPKH